MLGKVRWATIYALCILNVIPCDQVDEDHLEHFLNYEPPGTGVRATVQKPARHEDGCADGNAKAVGEGVIHERPALHGVWDQGQHTRTCTSYIATGEEHHGLLYWKLCRRWLSFMKLSRIRSALRDCRVQLPCSAYTCEISARISASNSGRSIRSNRTDSAVKVVPWREAATRNASSCLTWLALTGLFSAMYASASY